MNMDDDLKKVAEIRESNKETGQPFSSVLVIRRKTEKTARNGAPFLNVELGDNSGSFFIVCFNETENFLVFRMLEEGSIVKVTGVTDYYQDRFSPKLTAITPLKIEESENADWLGQLVETSLEDGESLWLELKDYIDKINHSGLKNTVQYAITERESQFRTSAAAISMHHAWRHGLLEHTIHMCRVADAILPLYPEVNADLVMSGIILHDIGKTEEYTQGMVTKKTRLGILQGHVIIGYQKVRKAALISKLSTDLTERLEHIVLSHQGALEWGAAVMAATPEAVFVSMVDNLDARMGMVQQAMRRRSEGDEFSDYMPGLQSPLLVADPQISYDQLDPHDNEEATSDEL